MGHRSDQDGRKM